MGEAQQQDLIDLFDVALKEVEKAGELLKAEEQGLNQKEAADRFTKLGQRFYDMYKLFMDTFNNHLNVVASKAVLLVSRAAFLVSHTFMKKPWQKMKRQPSLQRRLSTLPQRAIHRIYKRTVKKSFYTFNHRKEDYARLGFAKVFDELNQRNYEKEIRNVGTGLKEIGNYLLCLFTSTSILDNSRRRAIPVKGMPDPRTFSFDMVEKDLAMAKGIVVDYYLAMLGSPDHCAL